VTTPTDHYVVERLARGGIGQSGVIADPFEAWIDEWSLSGSFTEMVASAAGTDFAYEVSLTAQSPLIFHGENGYSVKSPDGQASYYYSQPYFDLAGTLTLPDGNVPVTGSAWLDREWSTQPLSNDQTGWDWFSLSFDAGEKLMGFRLRQSDGSYFTSATWIEPDGTTTAYPNGEFMAEPMNLYQSTGAALPTEWKVKLPVQNVDVVVTAINPDAWMTTSIPYWEGPIKISGSHSGRGYLEMTGYE
jgi:predicted secreted hydrolase